MFAFSDLPRPFLFIIPGFYTFTIPSTPLLPSLFLTIKLCGNRKELTVNSANPVLCIVHTIKIHFTVVVYMLSFFNENNGGEEIKEEMK